MADLTDDDLRAGVAAGVIDEAAAARLTALAQGRRSAAANTARDDEPFEFFRGFGEIFIAVGLCMAFGAFNVLARLIGGLSFAVIGRPGDDALSDGSLIAALTPYVLSAAAAWLLSYYFARRRRMSLPSIVLALAFTFACISIGGHFGDYLVLWAGEAIVVVAGAAAGVIAMAAYYLVFRLPFALAPLGASLLAMVVVGAQIAVGSPIDGDLSFPEAVFDLAQAPAIAIAVLLCGLALFAAAIRFDMRDPHRLNRFSAAAFWLHVVAAPAIVNTICLSLFNLGGVIGYLAAAAAFLLVSLVAIAIDRRSFLMAGVVYAGLALAAAVRAATGESFETGALTILLLGVLIAALGAQWTAARGRLMRALPDFPGKGRLPPY